jgi:predicted carbohydrate-binding protein with CBM5 and CBM33 domain
MESKEWERVDLPDKGCVIISPTGYAGPGGILSNGHTGIVGVDGNIMSNDSATGLFTQNYTIESWRKRYVDQGKFPMAFFRPI